MVYQRGEKKNKKNFIPILNYSMLLLLLINLIILYKICGAGTMGFFFTVFGVFYLLICITGIWQNEYTAKNVRGRINRGQKEGAGIFLKGVLLYTFVFSAIFIALLCLLGELLSKRILGLENYKLLFEVMSPCILLYGFCQCFSGYFRGIGTGTPIFISKLIGYIVTFIGSVLLGKYFFEYGNHVGELLKNSNMKYAYAALGICIGCLCGICISFLIYCICLAMEIKRVKNSYRPDSSKEAGKGRETAISCFKNILIAAIPEVLHTLCYRGILVIYFICFLILQDNKGLEAIEKAGYYIGIFIPIGGIVMFSYFIISAPHYNGMPHLKQIDDYRQLRDKVTGILKGTLYYVIPLCVFFFTLAETICEVVFEETNDSAINMLYCGIFLVVLVTLLFIIKKCQNVLGQGRSEFVLGIIGIATGLVVSIILFTVTDLSINAFFIGAYINVLILIILNGALLFRKVRIIVHMIDDIVKPLLGTFLSALIVFILEKAIKAMTIPIAFLLISFVIYLITYTIFTLLFRCIKKNELKFIPGNTYWGKIGILFHLY